MIRIGKLSIGMIHILGRKTVFPDPENRFRAFLPALHTHCILSHSPADQPYRQDDHKKEHGQDYFGNDCTERYAQGKPESGKRLKNKGIGHGHDQKNNGQQDEALQLPYLVADEADKNQGQP